MNAAFSSWPAFLAMGGYAFYVWLAVAVTLLSLAALLGHTLVARLLHAIRRQAGARRTDATGRPARYAGDPPGESSVNPRRKSRLYLAMVVVFGAAVTLALTLYALRANIDLFYTPSEILGGKGEDHQLPHVGQRLRISRMVMPGSVKRDPQTLQVTFKIYNAAGAVAVSYVGILPDLFREGQGVVAQGILAPGNRVEAREVLAKHDEKYTPPEVASAMSSARRRAVRLTAAAPPAARDASGAPPRSPAQSGEQP